MIKFTLERIREKIKESKLIVKIIYIGCFFILIAITSYFLNFHGEFSSDSSEWSNFGGYVAGTVGAILTFISALLIYFSFVEQQKQFTKQREQQFENNFQQLITNYYSLLNFVDERWLHGKLCLDNSNKKGREIFGNTITFLNQDLTEIDRRINAINNKVTEAHSLNYHGEPVSFESLANQKYICSLSKRNFISVWETNFELRSKYVYNTHINVFYHYCSYIIDLVNIIENNKELNNTLKNNYLIRLSSMFSFYELIFLAYFTKYINEDSKFKKIFEMHFFVRLVNLKGSATLEMSENKVQIQYIIDNYDKN